MISQTKKVLFFGIYDPDYSRSRVLIRGFKQNGFEVVECRVNPRTFSGLNKFIELYKQFKKIKNNTFEFVIVGFPGHSIVWLARILLGKDIIFDAFLSLYDSNVKDRKRYSSFHPRALYDWFLDWFSCQLSRYILVDTNEHIQYFAETFFISRKKLIRVLISADEEIFYPRKTLTTGDPLVVHFHGMFIPLQGIQYILDAAYILKNENIFFRIIGAGQEFERMKLYSKKLLLANVEFVGKIPFEDIPKWIADSHVCLGIFGDTEKTKRVIPNKVYEYVAMGKTVITANTPAIREVFTHELNMIFCNLADGDSIAKAISGIKSNPKMFEKIGVNARKLFEKELLAKTLINELLININNDEN
jgi:glycosyltransferase involved in cell wall biosynthesis